MKYFYSKAAKLQNDNGHPFVLLGHTKEIVKSKNLIRFIQFTCEKTSNHVKFVSLKDVLNELISINSSTKKVMDFVA